MDLARSPHAEPAHACRATAHASATVSPEISESCSRQRFGFSPGYPPYQRKTSPSWNRPSLTRLPLSSGLPLMMLMTRMGLVFAFVSMGSTYQSALVCLEKEKRGGLCVSHPRFLQWVTKCDFYASTRRAPHKPSVAQPSIPMTPPVSGTWGGRMG